MDYEIIHNKLVRFSYTNSDGMRADIFINTSHIVSLEKNSQGGTWIYIVSGNSIDVNETLEKVVSMITKEVKE